MEHSTLSHNRHYYYLKHLIKIIMTIVFQMEKVCIYLKFKIIILLMAKMLF